MMVLGILLSLKSWASFNELILPEWCDVNVSMYVVARVVQIAGGWMLRLEELWELMESFSWFSCQRKQRRCYLFPQSFVPGVPPPKLYSILWENILGDSVTSSSFVLEKILNLFRKLHLKFCFCCLVLR